MTPCTRSGVIGAPPFLSPCGYVTQSGWAGIKVLTRDTITGPFRNKLLAALNTEDYELLSKYLTEITLETEVLLHEAGHETGYVYFPQAGMISLLAVMSDGESIETATVGNEGVVGASSGFGVRLSFTRAVVQAPLIASRISATHFRGALLRSERLRNLMASYNELLLAQVQQTAACNALHEIEARLARWLLQTRDRIDGDVLPLTQEFLAQMLGVRRTSVNLVARQLQASGAITLRRGQITIIDRAGLEEVACECYGVVRDQLALALPK